jgi:hypothetical protein
MNITNMKVVPPLHSSAGRLTAAAGNFRLPIRQPSHMTRECYPIGQQVAAHTGSTQERIF